MNTAQHTPGPWTVKGMGRDWSTSIVNDKDLIASAHDFNKLSRDNEREANARLIAAAPDLLAALRDLSNLCMYSAPHLLPQFDATVEQARAAIAKATGG